MTEEELRAELLKRQLLARRSAAGGAAALASEDRPTSVYTENEQARDRGLTMRANLHGMGNGLSFGFGDNIAAGVGSLFGGESYDERLEGIQSADDTIRDYAPGATLAGDVTGAVVPALATGPIAGGKSLLGTMGRGMGLGTVEGAAHGAGNADGENVADAAQTGAMWGAGLGAGAPVAVAGGKKLVNALRDPVGGVIDGLLGRASPARANRALGAAVRQSGQPTEEVMANLARAIDEGQPEYRVMDALGAPGQRQASGIVRSGGDAATELTDFLKTRQLDQGDRVAGFVDDAFETRGTTANQTRDALTAARNDTASDAYRAAREGAGPVDVRGALGVIDSRLGQVANANGTGFQGDGIDSVFSRYRNRLAADRVPGDIDAMELSDFNRVLGVKQDLSDDIGAAVRQGQNNRARELTLLRTQLDEALEAASPNYRNANDGFRDASRTIEAVDQGKAMAGPGRAADNVQTFDRMTPDQQSAARVGYGDDLQKRLEGVTAPTSDRARALQSTKRLTEADTMVTDPALYRNRLGRETEMWETQNRALGGSRTADNQQDISAMQGLAGGALDMARSGGNFQFGDMVARLGGMVAPMAKGHNEATQQLIARALMSNDPQAALAPVLRQEMTSQNTNRVIEALLRNSAGQATR